MLGIKRKSLKKIVAFDVKLWCSTNLY